MKVFLIFFLLFVATQAEDIKERLIKTAKECVDEEEAKRISNVADAEHLPLDDEKLGKALVCYWRKLGIIKEDESIDLKKVTEFVTALSKAMYPKSPVNDLDDVVKNCHAKANADDTLAVRIIKTRNCILHEGATRHKQ